MVGIFRVSSMFLLDPTLLGVLAFAFSQSCTVSRSLVMEVIRQFYAGFVFPALSMCVCVCVYDIRLFNDYLLGDIKMEDSRTTGQSRSLCLSTCLSVGPTG